MDYLHEQIGRRLADDRLSSSDIATDREDSPLQSKRSSMSHFYNKHLYAIISFFHISSMSRVDIFSIKNSLERVCICTYIQIITIWGHVLINEKILITRVHLFFSSFSFTHIH